METSNRQPVAAIILTLDEEADLAAALDSLLGWAAEVFVVDSFSRDRTPEIARSYEARGVRFVQHAFEDYSSQWRWALDNLPISQPWVLKLDADERLTEDFKAEAAARLSEPGEAAAFTVRWRLVFMGRELRWGGWRDNGSIRLWRRGRVRLNGRAVNELLLCDGPVGGIEARIVHEDRKDLQRWLRRHIRYSTLEAREMRGGRLALGAEPRFFGRPEERRAFLRRVYSALPARPLLYFLYRYVLRLGFLDGEAGFGMAYLHANFLWWIELKHMEGRLGAHVPQARQEAEKCLPYFNHCPGVFQKAYEDSPDFIRRREVWTALIDEALRGLESPLCVDVGCGTGVFSLYAARKGARVIGLDPSEEMLKLCRAEAERLKVQGAEFRKGALPLAADALAAEADLVLCSSVLEYVEDPAACVGSLARLVKDGGRLIVSLPNRRSLYRALERAVFALTGRPAYYRHVRRLFAFEEAVSLFETAGLKLEATSWYGGGPAPWSWAAALLPQERGRNLFALVFSRPGARNPAGGNDRMKPSPEKTA